MAKVKFGTLALLASAALLAACASVQTQPTRTPAPAQPPIATNLAPKDRLVAAIEGENCLLRSDNVAKILLRANLTQDELMKLTPELAREGRAEVSGTGTIRVISTRCA